MSCIKRAAAEGLGHTEGLAQAVVVQGRLLSAADRELLGADGPVARVGMLGMVVRARQAVPTYVGRRAGFRQA